MSQQVQYNYYNTLATKINETTFIFRGKTNVPNLRIQTSTPDTGWSDYISTKLTIQPSEGTIEIEHEPITNYSKKVIVTIPLHLDIGSDSKEINLNNMIPKSIRFTIDETVNAIYLHPDTGGSSYKEGLSTKDQAKIDKKIADMEAKLNTRIVSGTATDNVDWECTPTIDENGKAVKTFTSTGIKEGKSQQAWNAMMAVVVAIVFTFITHLGAVSFYARIISDAKATIGDLKADPPTTTTYDVTKVLKTEFWILVIMLVFAIFIALFFTGYGGYSQRMIIGYVLSVYFLFIVIVIFSIFMYRKEKFIDPVAIKSDSFTANLSQYGPVRGFGVWWKAIRGT
jgi:hypothetical protein